MIRQKVGGIFPKLTEAQIVYKYFEPGIPLNPVGNGRLGTIPDLG